MVHFFRAENTLMGSDTPWRGLGKHNCYIPSDMDHGMPQQSPVRRGTACFRRFFEKLMIPTFKHRLSCHYYPSRASIVSAWTSTWKTSNPCIVHPFSTLALAWQSFILFLWTYLLLSRPYILAFVWEERVYLIGEGTESSTHMILINTSLICSGMLVLNIFMNFVTGFAGYPGINNVELRFPAIVQKYIWTYFLFDVVDAFPIATFIYIFNHINRAWMLLHVVQFVRAHTFYVYALNFSHLMHFNEFYVKIIRYFFAGAVLIHWLACIMHIVPVMIDENVMSEYLQSSIWDSYVDALNKVTTHFFLGVRNFKHYELGPLILAMLVGSIFKVLVVVQLLIQLRTYERTAIKYNSFLRDMNKYVQAHKVPENTHQRVKLYIAHKFQGKFYHESDFTHHLSEHLRHEIYLHSSGHLICTMKLCKNLSRQVIGEMLMNLEPVFYLPGDVLFTCGNVSDGLFFISYGKIAAYTEAGNEVVHFSDGDVLGLLGLNLDRHVWTVVAIEATEAFLLRNKEVRSLMTSHMELRRVFQNEFEKRYAQFINIAHKKRMTKFSGPNNNIIMELGNKKILEPRELRLLADEDDFNDTLKVESRSSNVFYKLMRLSTPALSDAVRERKSTPRVVVEPRHGVPSMAWGN